jgi:superfamily II DNA/RNA helicase
VIQVHAHQNKVDVLHDILIKEEFHKTLIFSRTKRGSDKLGKQLHQKGFKVDVIHGDKSQYVRSKVITRFKRSEISILVATDVAARGLDIQDITHVINYDEPESYEDYIHRIGRTGRIGKKGTALTFVSA